MRFANRIQTLKPGTAIRSAGVICLAAAWMLASLPLQAQEEGPQALPSGVSHPSTAPITSDANDTAGSPLPGTKPSAAIPAPAPASPPVVYGPYVPYHAPGTVEQTAAPAAPFDPDASIVTSVSTPQTTRRPLNDANDADADIVTYVPSVPGEIPDGTLVRATLNQDLSTLTTRPGAKFSAALSQPVMHDGQVVIPAGSVMEGRVTWLRSGKRLGASAAIHLEPRIIVLPDGSQYVLRARVIDTSSWENTKVDDEGTIMRRDHSKKTATAIGLSAGGGMAAGAMLGGLPGALVGAGVGAGVSTVVWLRQDREAELPKDLGLVFSLTEPMSIAPTGAAVPQPRTGGAGSD